MSQSTACPEPFVERDGGRSRKSPWIREAGLIWCGFGRTSGCDIPSWTGTPVRPMWSNTRSVFSVQFVERRVAVDRRRADQLDVRREGRDHQRDGVIRAGIDVEDDPGRHGSSVPGPVHPGRSAALVAGQEAVHEPFRGVAVARAEMAAMNAS